MDRNLGTVSAVYSNHGAKGVLHYQFGRKDPMHTISSCITLVSDQATLAKSVQNPKTYYYSNSNWCTEYTDIAYLWNDSYVTSYTSHGGEKSIFDPSPLGWRVPNIDTWLAFTGNTVYNSGTFPWASGVNDWDDSSKLYYNGRTYITTSAYYPASGYRSTNGSLTNAGANGSLWSVLPSSSTNGNFFYFDYDLVNSSRSNYRAMGRAIRSVQE